MTVTASAGSYSESAAVQIYPVNTPQLTGLALGVESVQGGESVTGTLTLSGPVGLSGGTVNLTSSNPTVVLVPTTAALSFGQSSASINIPTTGVTTQQFVTITATFANSTATATLLVNPVLTITLSPAAVVGGTPATGTVALAQAATANATVMLQSSDSKAASVPISVMVPAGQLSASFTISTTTALSTVIAHHHRLLRRRVSIRRAYNLSGGASHAGEPYTESSDRSGRQQFHGNRDHLRAGAVRWFGGESQHQQSIRFPDSVPRGGRLRPDCSDVHHHHTHAVRFSNRHHHRVGRRSVSISDSDGTIAVSG